MGSAVGYPGITGHVEVIDEERAALLHRVHGDRSIAWAPAGAAKGAGMIGIGFGADQFAVCRQVPEISSAGVKENASEGAEGADELGRVAAFKSGAGKLKKKPLERLLKLRRWRHSRISGRASQ